MIVVPWVVGLPYLNRQNTVQAKYVFEYTRIDVQICVYSEQVSTRSARSVPRLLPVPKFVIVMAMVFVAATAWPAAQLNSR